MISSLSDADLHHQTHAAATREKGACLVLLQHLSEVDRRRLYSARGYSSLWEYVHKALGYSEAQASERVAAVRLMTRVPEVREKLETGALTLTSTAKIASHIRREHMPLAEARDLLARVEGKSTREVERILVSESEHAVPRPDQVRPISQELTRITLEVDTEFMELLQRAKEVGGHAGSVPQELLKKTLREFVKKRELKVPAAICTKAEPGRQNASLGDGSSSANAQPDFHGDAGLVAVKPESLLRAPEVPARSRYIRATDRRRLRIRSGDRCEYIDPITGRRCESRTRLENDHIHAHALGGSNEFVNLRHLCRTHNVSAGVAAFGFEKMRLIR